MVFFPFLPKAFAKAYFLLIFFYIVITAVWGDSKNQRTFFDGLAIELGFHPSDKNKWYSVFAKDVLRKKVCL